jgi:heme iron utilization protein
MEGEQIMAEAPESQESPESREPPAWAARKLLRAARAATLATSAQGQPFASLVTPACAPDLSVLLLLSDLSEHTRHLRTEPRCAVLAVGATETANPQTAPRVTVTGLAEPLSDLTLKARWLAIHPYAAMYAGFGDFSLWRIRPLAGLFVGGFARATRLKQTDLTPDADAVAALRAAEADIIGHCNIDHGEALARLGAAVSGTAGPWRMATVDVDGCDLALGDAVTRVAWSAPVADAGGVRAELVRLVARR